MSVSRLYAAGSVMALCLLLAGCTISVAASNSPDWCPNPDSIVTCRR